MAARRAKPGVTLRPSTAADEDFLYSVYASTRQEELAQLNWTEEEKASFLLQQFIAQQRHYHEQYAGASHDLIEVDGQPGGRLYVARRETEIRVMEIALLPEYRGRGIGTWLLNQLLDEAARTARRVTIHVEKLNPARRLYARLGFAEIADRGVYLLLEWAANRTNESRKDGFVPHPDIVRPDRHDEQLEVS